MVYQRKVKLALSRAEAEAMAVSLDGVKLTGTASRALRKLNEALEKQGSAMDEKVASGAKGSFPAAKTAAP